MNNNNSPTNQQDQPWPSNLPSSSYYPPQESQGFQAVQGAQPSQADKPSTQNQNLNRTDTQPINSDPLSVNAATNFVSPTQDDSSSPFPSSPNNSQPTTPSQPRQDPNPKADEPVQSQTFSYVPRRYGGGKVIATIFGILLIAGAVIAGVSIVQNQQLRLGYAWDCDAYNFEVSRNGDVRVINGSTKKEPAQKAEVYINNTLVATLDVPEVRSGDSVVLQSVDVPDGGFAWRVKGTADCEDSGSYDVTPTLTQTPTPKPDDDQAECDISFNLDHQGVCWMEPRSIPVTYYVNSLPDKGGPFYMETDWYVAAPQEGDHHYTVTQLIEEGKSYQVTAEWPGVTTFNPIPSTVEVHIGLNVRDKDKNLIKPNCSAGLDYFWTPYVCPVTTPTPPSEISGSCSAVEAYDTDWNKLDIQDLSNLKAGDKIFLTITGNASSGTFDKARFTVNSQLRPEVTSTKPGSPNTFYDEYTIPEGITTFTVGAQVHHSDLGWF